ncbi:TusE/DsrC/DsvC family sulfur relay protein [Candidatus Endoriftia persephonae]|uniref:Sulfurtransferase n=1 Tax=Candidatus Endoriftia persephonae TaxID=393765 RepID=A0A9J7A318_9GAMM|nr:TusE/DsrC/DsvC family sulfur relay protein [Candidatus Endoriftia persephone]USF89241.1 TusE/DsrC/DsvC family sulfur relay protein [Candidatus Endoriftia persephone]
MNVSGKNIKTDRDGYIVNLNEWVPGFAEITAHEDELELTDEHWEVINFLREYYEEYQIPPAVSFLTKAIDKKLSEKANDKNGLFPKGGVEQALKLAGIPKKELIKHSNK